MRTRRIPYGPDERDKLAAFCGLVKLVVDQSDSHCLTLLAHYQTDQTSVHCLELPGQRVLVVRYDVGCPYMLATIWDNWKLWKRWYKDVAGKLWI